MASSIAFDIFAKDNASAVFEKLGKKVETTESKFGSFAKKAAVVGLAVGAALATVVVASVELASKFEDSQKRLEAALKASGTSFEELKKPIADANKSMEKLGFTNTDTADALANLTVATKNPVKSLKELGLAADLARFKHITLADAASALGKAMAGNLKPLKALGIDFPVAAGGAVKVASAMAGVVKAQKTYNDALAKAKIKPTAAAMDAVRTAAAKLKIAHDKLTGAQQAGDKILKTLADRLKGQAATAADTLAGKVGVLKTRFADIGIQLGTVLIPWLMKLVDAMSQALTWMQKHQAATKTWALVIGILAAAFITLSIAMAIVELINPFSAMALGVAAAVGGVIFLYTHFAIAKRIINDVGDAVKLWAQLNIVAFKLVADALKVLVRVFVSIFLNPILAIFGTILHAAVIAFGWIPGLKGPLHKAQSAFSDFRDKVNAIINSILQPKPPKPPRLSTKEFAADVARYKALYNSITGLSGVNYITTVFTNKGTPFPRAAGGPVAPGTTYLVGERGPELFSPNTAGNITPNNKLRSGSGNGGVYINEVHVHGVQNTSQLWQELQKYAKRNGSIKLSGVTA